MLQVSIYGFHKASHTKEYETIKELFNELPRSQKRIVQQAAPLVRLDGHPFDFRVHMQREQDERWVCSGMLARIGGAHSIVSNVGISKGQVVPVEEILSALFKDQPDVMKRIVRQLRKVGRCICRILDHYHDFNEIGVDLGVDRSGRLWLIEVNTNDRLGGPSIEMFALLQDKTPYLEILRRYENRQWEMVRLLLDLFSSSEEATVATNQ